MACYNNHKFCTDKMYVHYKKKKMFFCRGNCFKTIRYDVLSKRRFFVVILTTPSLETVFVSSNDRVLPAICSCIRVYIVESRLGRYCSAENAQENRKIFAFVLIKSFVSPENTPMICTILTLFKFVFYL